MTAGEKMDGESAASVRGECETTERQTTERERRTVVVTGGTSGLGEAIAAAFAREGCDIVAWGFGDAEVAACARSHPDWRVVAGDVSSAADVDRVRGETRRCDVLVNAAGILLRQGREFDLEGFARVVDVNLTGMMRVSTAFLPLLADRRGAVINIASMLSFFGSGFVPAYSASKGGVAQLTKSLAIAWAPRGVRVNAIAPGWIRTPLTAPLVADDARSQAILDRTPLGRWGEPEDVAGAALFLASPAAAFVTGVTLPVDGGYLIA